MCGRFTVKATWAELVALYRLTMDGPPHNLRPRYNVCPTDPVDVVTGQDDRRELVTMRWGLVPRWWSKPLKELRAATFDTPGAGRDRPGSSTAPPGKTLKRKKPAPPAIQPTISAGAIPRAGRIRQPLAKG